MQEVGFKIGICRRSFPEVDLVATPVRFNKKQAISRPFGNPAFVSDQTDNRKQGISHCVRRPPATSLETGSSLRITHTEMGKKTMGRPRKPDANLAPLEFLGNNHGASAGKTLSTSRLDKITDPASWRNNCLYPLYRDNALELRIS